MAKSSIGTAYIQVVPTTDGIKGSLTKALSGETSTAGVSAGTNLGSKIAGFAKKAITVAAIGTAIKASLTEGAGLEQAIGGIDTLFKSSADKVKEYAKDAYAEAGISAKTYMEQATSFSAALISSLGGDTAAAAEYADMAIKDMADNSAKMGTSIEDIQNAYQGFAKQNYTMLDNLKLGYGGTKTEMERLLADAEKISGVHYDIDNLSDVYEAIHVIQGELGIAGVAADEAKTTLSGSFNAMKAAAQDFMGYLTTGADVTQQVKNLVDTFCTFAFDNVIPAVVNIVEAIFPAVGSAIVKGVPKILGYVMQAIPQLIKGIISGLQSLSDAILQAVENFSNNPEAGDKIMEKLKTFIQSLITLLPQLLEVLGNLLYAVIYAVLTYIDQMWNSIFSKIGNGLSNMWNRIKTGVSNGFNDLKSNVVNKMNAIKDAIHSAIERIKSFFNITLRFNGIKLPHITVSWNKRGALAKIAKKMGLPGIPDFGVSWYKTGGIFDDPSVIGVGEAGSEAVVPLDKFWAKIDEMSDSIVSGVALSLAGINTNQPITVQTYLYPNGPVMDKYTVEAYDRGKRRLG